MLRLRIATVIGTLLVIILLGFGAVGWYYAAELEAGALEIDLSVEPDLTVIAVGNAQVTLAVTDKTDLTYGDWRADGVYGINWEGGYAQVGPIIEVSSEQVTREFFPVSGHLSVGQDVNFEGYAFDGDPSLAHGIQFEDVTITSDLGKFEAWLVEGDEDTWAIYPHGKAADREESLRMLPIVTDLGLTSLVITYRNDEGAPASESGYDDYGLTGWK